MVAVGLPQRFDIGDLSFDVIRRPNRQTLEITVERDASLWIKLPDRITIEQVESFVAEKRSWIYRKLVEKDALRGPTVTKQLVDGEGFAYLGRNHRLLLVDGQDAVVRLDRGRLRLRRDCVSNGSVHIRDWYSTTGAVWLRNRVAPWTARMQAGMVDVRVADLGYRWGSTRGTDRINIHWATLQLRPSLIDYVLAHELAHLHEMNHTRTFWTLVERALPTFADQRSELACSGSRLWLGTTTS